MRVRKESTGHEFYIDEKNFKKLTARGCTDYKVIDEEIDFKENIPEVIQRAMIEKPLGAMTVKELREKAKTYPKEEWQGMVKKELVEYLKQKINGTN